MKVMKSYASGIKRATSEGKMLLVLWFFNVLFASVIYFQFSDYLNRVFGTSAAAGKFLKSFDFNTFFEMMTFNGTALNTIVSLAKYLLLFYGIATIFLAGGILHTLSFSRGAEASSEKRRVLPLFFHGAGKYFGRFLRLFLYSWVLWLVVVVFIMFYSGIVVSAAEDAMNEPLISYLALAGIIVLLFLIFLIRMIVDYARIKIVVEDSPWVFLSLFRSVGFVFRKLFKTLAIYYLFFLTGAALWTLFWLVQKPIKTHSLLPILLAFFIGQIFILSRGWIKVGLQGAQLEYYRSVVPAEETPEPESIKEEASESEPAPPPPAEMSEPESAPKAAEEE
jgi:hypothetical protein